MSENDKIDYIFGSDLGQQSPSIELLEQNLSSIIQKIPSLVQDSSGQYQNITLIFISIVINKDTLDLEYQK